MAGTTTHHRAHPKPRDYWMIALILGVITAVEIAVAYIEALDGVIAPILIVLSVAKFALVAMYFMHLRYEKKLYTRFFVVGIVGAIVLFFVVLLTFGLLIS